MKINCVKWIFPVVSVITFACGTTPQHSTAAFESAFSSDLATVSLSNLTPSDGGVLLVNVKLAKPEGSENTSVSVSLDGVNYPLYRHLDGGLGSYQGLLGIPYGRAAGKTKLDVDIKQGAATEALSVPFEVVAGQYASEQLRVEPKHVSPPKSALKRIQREVQEIAAIYKKITEERFWDKNFQFPIKSAVTSQYGTKRIFNGKVDSVHLGLDLRAPIGTPIRAPAGGKVVLAKDLYFTGNTVLLDHGFGLVTIYAHMSNTQAKLGQTVKAGDVLGLSGMTGRASGPHLHWGAVIRHIKVNPLELTRMLQ